jgi:ubiquinone/menaquinone biosynthesis C-methylase UbiE
MKRLSQLNINQSSYFDEQFNAESIERSNNLRQEHYLKIIEPYKPTSVIELGCGISYFLPMAAEKYPDVWGLDFAPQSISRMKKEFPDINYVVGDAMHTPFKAGDFDAVVAGEIIEHMEEPEELVREMARITRDGGVILISTPHLEFDDPEHLWEFEESDLRRMLSYFGEPQTMTLNSEIFPGRSYLFAWCQKTR